jgi:sugar/nucleoside kinase (ribokinase family)
MIPVFGFGNPLIDAILDGSEELLEELGVAQGSMNLVDSPTQQIVLSRSRLVRRLPGGSCANTLRGIAWLLSSGPSEDAPVYTGAVGQDDDAVFFGSSLSSAGVRPLLAQTDQPTGTSYIVVTPNHERTMFTCLGACREFQPDMIDHDLCRNASIFHVAGYMWDTPNQQAAAEEMILCAKEAGSTVSFDIADSFVVDRYRKRFLEWLPGKIDLLFANRDELAALTGVSGSDQSILTAAEGMAATVVMKTGADGCLIREHSGTIQSPGFAVQAGDTTGAGDAFAAGFLAGCVRNVDTKRCAELANFVASRIVTVEGCDYTAIRREEIDRLGIL